MLTDDPASLELPPAEMRAMADATVARVLAHIASLPDQPAIGDYDNAAARCHALREPPPEAPTPFETLLDQIFDEYVPCSYTTSGPRYLAYIPGGGVFPAALADLIQDTTNRYTGIWHTAPLLVQLEANVLEWLTTLMGFPPEARGLLGTGGSAAAFSAIVCARERHLGTAIREGVLYASTQVHHSVAKAARLAGIAADRIRAVPVDEQFRLQVPALAAAIDDDRGRGLRPFLVVSSAGTTNTGAVDPLEAIADLCATAGLWHHVDGAYGAFFHLCDEVRPVLRGLPRADSLTLDPHKGLCLPYGTGALLVRDGAALRAVHSASASYLPPQGGDELYDPSQYSPDLSRGAPGFRVWLCLKVFGLARYRAALTEKHELAEHAAARLAQLPGIRIVAPPLLSLLAFQLAPPGATLEECNRATRQLLQRLLTRRRVFLSGATVDDGRFLARICVLSFRTRRPHIDACVREIEEESAAILRGDG